MLSDPVDLVIPEEFFVGKPAREQDVFPLAGRPEVGGDLIQFSLIGGVKLLAGFAPCRHSLELIEQIRQFVTRLEVLLFGVGVIGDVKAADTDHGDERRDMFGRQEIDVECQHANHQ
ncbi:hypothetical protein D3C80_1615360 [compost metagenome]